MLKHVSYADGYSSVRITSWSNGGDGSRTFIGADAEAELDDVVSSRIDTFDNTYKAKKKNDDAS